MFKLVQLVNCHCQLLESEPAGFETLLFASQKERGDKRKEAKGKLEKEGNHQLILRLSLLHHDLHW